MGQGRDALHASDDFVTVSRVARPFPFRHPVSDVSQPIGTDTQTCRCRTGILLTRQSQPHRINVIKFLFGIAHFFHQVTAALIRGQIIIETVPRRLADACLLRSTAPMAHVVTRPQSGKRSEMIHVALRRVAAHSHGHPPKVGTAGAQETVPQPHIGGQFRVVPCVPAHVIPPCMTHGIVGVHKITVVPETVPAMLIDSLHVIVQIVFQTVLHPCLLRVAPVGQAPHPEGMLGMEVFRCAQQGGIFG